MKKLIAISVVFALVAGTVFAVDVTGTVFGHVNVIEGSTEKDSKVTASGGMDRVRIDGSGEAGDGAFGGYIRAQGDDFTIDSANAWWKPIDEFKLIIGNNSDGIWGKEGVTGWGFNQMPNDSGIATNYGIWFGGTDWASGFYQGGPFMCNRYTFYEGVTNNAALMEITPNEMVGINIAIPFFDTFHNKDGDENLAATKFQAAVFQLNLNLDFGTIAVTYDGGGRTARWGDGAIANGAIFGYFGGTFGELGIDFGLSYHLTGYAEGAKSLPLGVGVGVKYNVSDTIGLKFRTTAALAGDKAGPGGDHTYINVSVLPNFIISDNMAAFINVGLGMFMPSEGDSIMGWYFNPYLRVGAEWGPTFYVGIKVESSGIEDGNGDKPINWSVPVSLMVSF